jgi:hypothetical protein
MDRDIYNLIFLYLLKARELAVSGQEHKAILQLGLSPEAVPVLKRLPMAKLEELAQSNVTCFAMRFPAQFWKDLAQEDAAEPITESLFMHLLTSVSLGEDDDDFTPET